MTIDIMHQKLIFPNMKANGEDRIYRIVPWTEQTLLELGYKADSLLNKCYPDYLFFYRVEDRCKGIKEDFVAIPLYYI